MNPAKAHETAIRTAILEAAQGYPAHVHIWTAKAMLDAFGDRRAIDLIDAMPQAVRREHSARMNAPRFVAADLAKAMTETRFAEPPPRSVWESITPGMAALSGALGVAFGLWIMGVI
jgi:hypothetical protein